MHEDVDLNFWGQPIYHGNKDTDRITVSDFIHVFTGFLNYHKQNPEINENSAPEAFLHLYNCLRSRALQYFNYKVNGDFTTKTAEDFKTFLKAFKQEFDHIGKSVESRILAWERFQQIEGESAFDYINRARKLGEVLDKSQEDVLLKCKMALNSKIAYWMLMDVESIEQFAD